MQKKHSWTRRDFIAKPAAFLAASQLLKPSGLLFAEPSTPAPAATKKIITRTLGRTGFSLPIVSMGEPANDNPGIVRRAYELGIRHFDTAALYQGGKNEVLLGNAIKDMGVRKDVIMASKIEVMQQGKTVDPALAGPQLKTSFEAGLKRLQTDYLDILYLHNVDDLSVVAMEGLLQALTDLKKQGRIRAIGISMHHAEPVLKEVVRLGVYDVVLFPFNYSMATDQGLLAAIESAHKSGVGIVAMKTTAGNFGQTGGLPGVSRGAPPSGPPSGQAGGPTGGQAGSPQGFGPGGRLGVSGATRTALLKWVLRHDMVATLLSEFGTYDHIEQNFSVAYDLAYTDDEKKVLADKKLIASIEFCHQCSQCKGSCPNGADIPTLMRTHMYALQYYPGTGHPHETLASIPAGRGLEACSNCDSCSASCAWTVNIPRKINQLQAWQKIVQA